MSEKSKSIPFNEPCLEGREIENIIQSIRSGKVAGDGVYSRKCEQTMENLIGAKKVLLTTSGTDALELSAILYGINQGDEVIMPSYTFVSTANAFCLRGARPVFVDIDPQTLNISPELVEAAVTGRTKAIVPVHYAGVGCDMEALLAISVRHGLRIIEDACHGFLCSYKGRALGTWGDVGCFSFHETKTFISGEGGAVALNNEEDIARAEIIREKGTNRSAFFRGEVDKYTWVDTGSSFLPSDLICAFLYGQIEARDRITEQRRRVFALYDRLLSPLEETGNIRKIFIPEHCDLSYHMFYILTSDLESRTKLLRHLKERKVCAVFHYVPLHSSPYAKKIGINIDLPITDDISNRIIRLPFFNCLRNADIRYIAKCIYEYYNMEFNIFF